MNQHFVFKTVLKFKKPRWDSLPRSVVEHGSDAPPRAEHVQRFRETVVIDEPGVHWENAHHQDDVAPLEKHVPDLKTQKRGRHEASLDNYMKKPMKNASAPRSWFSSVCGPFHTGPSRERRGTWWARDRGLRTSQQTGRGKWWWCTELREEDIRIMSTHWTTAGPESCKGALSE